MIQPKPYIEPAKGKVADYKRICERREVIVFVRQVLGRWFVKRIWHNRFGGGQSVYQMLPAGDASFVAAGHFTIALPDWVAILKRSENGAKAVAKVPVHEWMFCNGGRLTYHDLPAAKLGDPLTLLAPYTFNPPLLVTVRLQNGTGIVMYYEHLTLNPPVPHAHASQ